MGAVEGANKLAPGHRYETFAGKKVEYDVRGNLIKYGTTEYKYDPWNRLVESVSVRPELVEGEQKTPSPPRGEGRGEGDSDLQQADKSDLLRGVRQHSSEVVTVTYVYSHYNVIEEYTGEKLTAQYINGAKLTNLLP